MTPDMKMPRKAVIVLGFTEPPGEVAAALPGLPYGALAERLPVAARQGIQQAVEEVLSAGLMELVFVSRDGIALADASGAPRQVLLTRGRAGGDPGRDPGGDPGGDLGAALHGARALIGSEPFVVLTPECLLSGGRGVVARLLDAYRRRGGNLAFVADAETLEREGTFSAIAGAATGPYLLQPEVLDALEAGANLAGALLALAEAWPVTALPLRAERRLPSPLAVAGAAD